MLHQMYKDDVKKLSSLIKIIISKYNQKGLDTSGIGIKIIPVKKIEEVFSFLFG